MVKKKILIIAKNFLPYFHSIGGVLRALKLAEFLDANGYHTIIIAAKGAKLDYFGYEELVKRLDIRYVSDFLQKRDNLSNTKQSVEKKTRNNFDSSLKATLHDIVIPDKGIILIWKYINATLNLIKKEKIDAVIISSPPFSTQIIGPIIKVIFRNRIKFIADYRDGWNVSKINSKELLIPRSANFLMEKFILHYSDYITCASYGMKQEMQTLFPYCMHKTIVIMNGFDEKMLFTNNDSANNTNSRERLLTIGYFGSISDGAHSYRNPTLLLQEIEKNNNISISFYGNISMQKKWLNELGSRLVINQQLSHNEAVRLMSQFDVLLVIHTEKFGGAEVLTGKLFDYLISLKPILVIGPPNMEAGLFVVKNGFGYFADCTNSQEIGDTLQKIYSDWVNNRLPHYNLEDIRGYSRQYQYRKFVDLIER